MLCFECIKNERTGKSVTNLRCTIMMSSGKWTHIDPTKKHKIFPTSFTLCVRNMTKQLDKTWTGKSPLKGHLRKSICICSKCNFHWQFSRAQEDKQLLQCVCIWSFVDALESADKDMNQRKNFANHKVFCIELCRLRIIKLLKKKEKVSSLKKAKVIGSKFKQSKCYWMASYWSNFQILPVTLAKERTIQWVAMLHNASKTRDNEKNEGEMRECFLRKASHFNRLTLGIVNHFVNWK